MPKAILETRHRGFRIIATRLDSGWQARIEGIGALSDYRPTALDAIDEVGRYLDDQAAERYPHQR